MFTTSGKNIISKYLLGQTPAFASYIAIGCGAKPLNSSGSMPDVSLKQALDFEAFRAKIISRGYVNDGATSNIVLTAELPSDERYGITEIGLFPSQMNDAAGSADSKILLRFNQNELWKINNQTVVDLFSNKLDSVLSTSIPTLKIVAVNADNPGISQDLRIARQEVPRFGDRSILVRGNNTDYISLTNLNIDINKNTSDNLKFAYSLLSNDTTVSSIPSGLTVNITIKFKNNSGAYYQATIANTSVTASSRYQVATIPVNSLVAHTNNGIDPSLNNISSIEISANVSGTGVTASDYWIDLDGLRLDATSWYTSVYDLVGYRIIKNTDGLPITKDANSSNFIEFRFNLGVG